jgi:hypothetical protein
MYGYISFWGGEQQWLMGDISKASGDKSHVAEAKDICFQSGMKVCKYTM